jgi:hypothetical protein
MDRMQVFYYDYKEKADQVWEVIIYRWFVNVLDSYNVGYECWIGLINKYEIIVRIKIKDLANIGSWVNIYF